MWDCRKYFLCLVFLFALIVPAGVGYAADEVVLKVDSPYALVDGTGTDLQMAPSVIDGTTLVPLRFLAETFGTAVSWSAEDKEITLRQENRVIQMRPDSKSVVVDNTEKTISAAPVVKDGVVLVPLRFLVENLNFKVSFKPVTKEIHINRLPPPNRPPVAEFTVLKDTVAQGETVFYTDKSYDPEGDQLVERKWIGNERAFFKPGDHEVSLQVKDEKGAWSEPFTKVIRVTETVKMDELTYNFNNPLPGQPLATVDIPVLDYKRVNPVGTTNREKVMISNSPETVTQAGILYKDVLRGQNRLYYHHLNGTNGNIQIYLLAVNQGEEPVDLKVNRWGVAGPADPLAVGRAAAYRFLDFSSIDAKNIKLLPGEEVVLNEGNAPVVYPGRTVHGIFSVDASQDVLFVVAAVKNSKQLDQYEKLRVLPRDGKHIRGTYLRGNRNMLVKLGQREPSRLVIADGNEDRFLYGKDGEEIYRNKGNYGLIYRVTVRSEFRAGVLFSPRGGVFAGAGAWEGDAFNLPNRGVMQPGGLAMIGVIEPGQEKVLEFIPPAGSYLPVNLIFIPF